VFENGRQSVKHALFVAFHYPPEASSSGVLRTLKFSRYLAEYGWRVSVLTLERTAYDTVDPSLEQQIPDWVRVVRTPYIHTKQHLSIRGRYLASLATPDAWIGWYFWAVPAGRRLLAADPASVVFSTSPYPTAHLIARKIAARARVPFVADFRDPWYEVPPEPGTPRIVHAVAPILERAVVRSATHVVTSTAQLRDLLRLRYTQEPPDKFTEILNGYDEADFSALPAAEPKRDDSMLIIHAGNINADFRDPAPLFEAIGRLARRG
jgi:hypothetical protein